MLIERKRIPDKIYYSISEVSTYTEVEPHVLRYWETKFSKLKPKRVGGNQRKYTRNDLELLFVIKNLLYNDGYTLDGAEKKLKEGYGRKNSKNGQANSVVTVVEEVVEKKPEPQSASPSKTPDGSKELIEIKKELRAILRLLSSSHS